MQAVDLYHGTYNLYYIYALQYLLVYLFSTFGLLLVFSATSQKTNNVLRSIKLVGTDPFVYHALIIFIANLVGVPPFSGFVVKGVVLASVASKFNPMLLLGFFILLVLSTIFYLQFLKLIRKNRLSLRLVKINVKSSTPHSPYNNFKKRKIILWLLFFVLFYIFFYKDFALIFSLV